MNPAPNILVIRLGLLGDMLCTTPMLEAIKMHFPEGRLCVLSNEYNRPVIARNPFVDQIYTYIHSRDRQRNPRPGFMTSLVDAWRLKQNLRRERFDWIVVCNGGFNKASVRIAQKLGGLIISATREDGSFEYRVDFPISGLLNEPVQHEVVRTFKLLQPIGIGSNELPVHLTLSAEKAVFRETRKRLKPIANQLNIAIHISSRDPRREWPIARFGELIQEIVSTFPANFWIIHAPDDLRRGQSLSKNISGIPHRLVAPVNIEELIATLDLATIVVCQEGGILHIAAGLQKPIVGLFENTQEKVGGWYPWGSRYRLVTSNSPGGLIIDIPSGDVAGAVLDLFAEITPK